MAIRVYRSHPFHQLGQGHALADRGVQLGVIRRLRKQCVTNRAPSTPDADERNHHTRKACIMNTKYVHFE